jgi:hypothetical protein
MVNKDGKPATITANNKPEHTDVFNFHLTILDDIHTVSCDHGTLDLLITIFTVDICLDVQKTLISTGSLMLLRIWFSVKLLEYTAYG